jgi:hypothetical protein
VDGVVLLALGADWPRPTVLEVATMSPAVSTTAAATAVGTNIGDRGG